MPKRDRTYSPGDSAHGTYSPDDIAKWILGSIDRDSGDSITHLKLQKLLYYSQAWALVILERPLFDEDFQAWTHGPVLPSIFHEYKDYSWEAIPAPDTKVSIDEETEALLKDVLSVYGELSAKRLESITHREAPWTEARGDLPDEARCTGIISKDRMRDYYSTLYAEADE